MRAPVASSDRFVIVRLTTTVSPALARAGSTLRLLARRTCERYTTIAESSGTARASTPARARSTIPSSSPHASAVTPAAIRQLALVVNPVRGPAMCSARPRHGGGRGAAGYRHRASELDEHVGGATAGDVG